MAPRTWLYSRDGVTVGPVSESVLVRLAGSGHLDGSTPVWSDGLAGWVSLGAAGIDGVVTEDEPGEGVPVVDPGSRWVRVAFYLGWLSLLVVPGPLAVAAGVRAVRELRRTASLTGLRPDGLGRAVFGLVMGLLASALIAWVIVTSSIGY